MTPRRSASAARARRGVARAARTTARARRRAGGTASRAGARRTAAASRSRCSRRRSRWWAEDLRRGRSSSRARTSCSSTGAPRSRETRAWVSRSMLPRGARIQPSRRPPQKLLLALPRVRVSGANEANGRGIDRPSSASAWCASSTTAMVRERGAGGRRTPRAGRRSSGGRWGSGSPGSGRPASARSGAARPRPRRGPSRRDRPGRAPAARPRAAAPGWRWGSTGDSTCTRWPGAGEGLRHDRDGAQCARGHHDLAGVGRQPPRVVRRRDRLLERRQPGGVVAVPGEVRRQVVHRGGVRLGQAGRGLRGRAVEVDGVLVPRPGEQRPVVGAGPTTRERREGAGATARRGVPRVAPVPRRRGSPWCGRPRAPRSGRARWAAGRRRGSGRRR